MKEYRVEIHHFREFNGERDCAEEILWFDREGLTSRDWDNIILALRGALRASDDHVVAEIYVDRLFYALASLWRECIDPSNLHLDVCRVGKYMEIRTIKEVA